ncbi:MAG: hypothetical protein IID37_08675 [Planctomycetes bacterium]|nr:hypothetical protein [Planctomycetota bacterium]
MDERLGNAHRILHLTTGDHATGTRLADFLTECGAEIQPCSDVYRGLALVGKPPVAHSEELARLGKPRPGEQLQGRTNSIDAVLVGVDCLSAGEFEFFELCASLQNPPPVWVYGGRDAQAKIALGLRLGAELEADVDSLRSAFVRLASPGHAPARDHNASSPTLDEPRPERVPLVACPPVSEANDARVDSEAIHCRSAPDPETLTEAASEVEVSDPLPVPWTRDHDGPRRTPPQTLESQPTSEPQDEGVAADDADGPLLTEQELEALIGRSDDETDR